MRAANFFRAAGLIGFRAVAFFAGAVAFLGVGARFRFAQASFIAAPIRFLAAGDIVRVRCADLGGRPLRGRGPSRAAIALSSRLNSAFR